MNTSGGMELTEQHKHSQDDIDEKTMGYDLWLHCVVVITLREYFMIFVEFCRLAGTDTGEEQCSSFIRCGLANVKKRTKVIGVS